MALTAPRVLFGVHQVTPYSLTTGEPYGVLRVLGNSSLSLSGELVKLNGGSNRYPWAIEDGNITAEMSLTIREYPNFVFELFLGKAPTDNAAEASASVTTLTNYYGTSVKVATTGIASVTVKSGSESDVKFGKYLVKAVSATTVDVYAFTDADFRRGTDGSYQSDLLKITSSALTITSGMAVTIPNFGLELNGGSGTIGMTTGDTATFYARPINTDSMDVTIGSSADVFPIFGCMVIGQKRGNGEMVEIELFQCKGIGLPLGFQEKAWSEAEVKVECFYDSTNDAVFKIRHVTPSTVT